MRRWVGRHEVALYLVLAFLISWSIWPLVLVNPDSSPLVPFGPGTGCRHCRVQWPVVVGSCSICCASLGAGG